MNENEGRLDEDGLEALPPPPRAPAWLAVIRIICVLGMSVGISLGIFLLLLPSWLGIVSLLAAIPFFALMRYVEKHATPEVDV